MIHQTKANSLRKITFRLNALKICENKCYARETTYSQKRKGDRRQRGREGKVAKGGGEAEEEEKEEEMFIHLRTDTPTL